MSNNKRYLGVDLGAWSGTKTRIAVLLYDDDNLKLLKLQEEPSRSTIGSVTRNERLKDCLLKASGRVDTVIAVDAPFAIPSPLTCCTNIEKYYPYEKNENKKLSIQNQYLFDNSARFVYEVTKQWVLAPTATLVGALTSRMVHIVDNYSDILGVCKTPHLRRKEEKISTIEVFPTATLYQMIRTLSAVDQEKYMQPYTKKEEKSKNISKFTKIISYKKTKSKPAHFNDNKERMLKLIKPYLVNEMDDLKEKIKTDDDYDAIICALTAYLVDKKDGYLKPDNKEDLDKFTNSFIYIPNID